MPVRPGGEEAFREIFSTALIYFFILAKDEQVKSIKLHTYYYYSPYLDIQNNQQSADNKVPSNLPMSEEKIQVRVA